MDIHVPSPNVQDQIIKNKLDLQSNCAGKVKKKLFKLSLKNADLFFSFDKDQHVTHVFTSFFSSTPTSSK